MRGSSVASILILALLACPPARAAASREDSKFERLAAAFLDGFFAHNPVAATQIGDHRHDAELDDVGPAGIASWAETIRGYRARLDGIDRERLSPENQVDADLMAESFEGMLFSVAELREHEWNPLRANDLLGGGIYGLVARDFAPWPARLRSALGRLRAIPRAARQARANLGDAPRIHVETAVQQNQGTIRLIEGDLASHFGEAPDLEPQLRQAAADAVAALTRYGEWLEKDLLPRAGRDFRLGTEMFDRKLRYSLASDLSREEILRRAESEYERVRGEMYRVAREIYRKKYPHTAFPERPDEAYRTAITRAALEEVASEHPRPEDLLDAARGFLDETTAFVRGKDLIALPDEPIRVIEVPEFMRGVAVAYCDAPGPLDRNLNTYYMVSPIPADWTKEQVESYLREYNTFSLRELTIHEAMPGHYVQLAHSNRFPSVLRAVFGSGTFVEGWAVYAEKVTVDAGFMDGDPRMRLVNLKWYLRAILNAILDQKIHTAGMSEDEAMRLMIEGGFQEEREAAGKWRRACLTSTQLSTYFVGYQEHADMRRDMEARLGSGFDLKTYHDRLLGHGSPPMKYIRRLLLK